jgi:hypothetical protein
MTPAPRTLPLLLAGLTLASVLAIPARSASGAISTRESGLVCDAAEQLCYDRNGLSLPATAQNFGRFGEDKARRLLRQGERGRTFLLSNGVACDVTVRTCWDDGWKRRNVSNAMTRHLFGRGTPGWSDAGSGNGNGNGSGYSAQCLLRQGGRTVFQGNCELRERGEGRERRFIASMRNGPRYVFQNERGGYRIVDGSGGSWPVDYRDYGRAAVFRWADMSLETRQGSYGGSSDRNRTLEELLRQLFN